MLKPAGFRWRRNPNNPILPPEPAAAYECTACMNPFVIRVGDEYRLYYAGGDAAGHRRICLATAPVSDPARLTRRGVVLDLGEAGAFDGNWCVLPLVHRIGGKWRLYYSGNDGSKGAGLQGFRGIGLAFSEDGYRFERYGGNPVITGDQTAEYPDNRGVAGGGSILEDILPDGSLRYRMYYTLAVGRPDPDIRVDQEKLCAVCHSGDGIHWADHRIVLRRRDETPSEDAAVAAPFVWRDGEIYRMLYCGIGTRWGYYSISEAVSADGYDWSRGTGDENLSLAPRTDEPESWESQMVEYPAVIREGHCVRLYYCGNGYGRTGIGTAIAPVA